MAETKKQIIVYSDDSSVRSSIASALGVRVAKDLPEHEITAVCIKKIEN
jgi:hypothetical protein